MRVSSSHEEGCERLWETSTKEILRDEAGRVRALRCVKVSFDSQTRRFNEVPGSEFEIPVSCVLLAMGFVEPSRNVLEDFGVATDRRGNAVASLETDETPFATNVAGVFACGDVRSGQSLVVRAMSEGRRCARAVDLYLMAATDMAAFRP